MNKRLLLLSNSTNPGEAYLSWPMPYIKDFLGKPKKILFIPYAGVSISYEDYFTAVAGQMTTLGHEVTGIHQIETDVGFLNKFDAIAIGGGNTFRLADLLQGHHLIETLREAVENGMPYFGWSAGSNIACPTIKTTNDMPIVEPRSFNGLNLIPFQINPHYTEATIPNHGGESREMRLKEFTMVNQDTHVACLPEGSFLRLEGQVLTFGGGGECKVFKHKKSPVLYAPGEDLSWLMRH
ncbi:MAG: dipeptidase PepE [Cyclobacteriaceae bacterium]|nr:dipeptidase PepE [Cyclobacteriaceae bacterium]